MRSESEIIRNYIDMLSNPHLLTEARALESYSIEDLRAEYARMDKNFQSTGGNTSIALAGFEMDVLAPFNSTEICNQIKHVTGRQCNYSHG